MKGRRLVLAKWVEEVRIAGIVIPNCQGCRTPDWPNLGYEAHSRRPSSPVRLDPSTAGLRENKRLGNSFLIDYSWLSILVLIERYLYFPS
jgi:hypothetical protein